MEAVDANQVTTGNLGGVSLSSHVIDDSREAVKPTSEERVGGHLVPENEALCGGGGGDAVVITKTVVEETEVTVKVIQEEVKGTIVKNQENETQETEKEGGFCNFIAHDSEDTKKNVVSVSGENGSKVKRVFDGETKHENGAEIFESHEDSCKNDEGNVEENGAESAEDETEEDHDFVVGDFVWGKIKSHPWWPGQIYNPSDASDYASKFKRKGRLLVAYFGDGSFSWCSPSQLKPFVDYFEEMSNQSGSKNFVNAVQAALDEIGRLVEAKLVEVDRVEVDSTVANSGIKAGVAVPIGNTIRVLIDRMGPVELLQSLKASALMESEKLVDLDLTVVRSCLSAFFRQKGGYVLPVFHEPKCIEGLEDKIRTGNVVDLDINGPENTDDKLYQGRKQKSVAELLSIEVDEPKIKKPKMSKSSGSGTKERKRKVVVVAEPPDSDPESGGSGGGGGEEQEEITTPRERKKSKYLSPPYTSPIWSVGRVSGSGSGSVKEPKPEPETADKLVEDSFVKKSRKTRRLREEESDSRDSKIMDASKILNWLLRAALDPWSLNENKNLMGMTEFVLCFRGSVFKDGPAQEADSGPVTLVVEFMPGVTLPTKSDLLKTYRKFGELVKKETRMEAGGGCRGYVGFVKGDDAEAALEMTVVEKPFGAVKCHLREEGDLGFVKEKLVAMREMVQECEEGEMSGEMKVRLEEGIKELLQKLG